MKPAVLYYSETGNPEVLGWLKKNRPEAYKTAVTAKGKPDDTDYENVESWVKQLYQTILSDF
ncbi:MAG: hypothetical protein JW822_03885 [Spirochaetales bacterium]|nr:hypothetical protein [Spirochaetales bacterium]